ncbi:MAG: iron ABC transporter permease [Rhodoferax sp.]|nr:iron ABC transporter permease [Rhodoferax sp.]
MKLLLRGCLLVLAGGLALPVLTLFGSWLHWSPEVWQVLLAMAETVLPEYVGTSLLLCLLVSIGVISMGTVSAAAVTLFDFPMRKTLEWALLLPLAMPAYVVAYAYTDFLQFSGPLQGWMRAQWGLQGKLLPEVRSVWGAAGVFTLALYPYVYLLARTALADRANHLMEAARLLGAPLRARIWRVALPLARPAIAAGCALALMETLADFGVSSYFGIQTFTAGIYKAWIVMDNRIAAAQLATALLLLVSLVLTLELRAESKMRFSSGRTERHGKDSQPLQLRGPRAWLAWLACSLPVAFGFVIPVAIMLRALINADPTELPWERFFQWTQTSLGLGLLTAALAVATAYFLAAGARMRPGWSSQLALRTVGLGYAVPGVVIVVGLLLPLGWIQGVFPNWGAGQWLTATSLGLVWAYLVRFVSVALQSVQSGYTKISHSLDESARLLGASGLAIVREVHWPQLKKPIYAATLLVLVDVLKELPVTLVLRPFNTDTLAVMAYQLARDERLGEAALPSLALVLAGLLPVILLSRTLRSRPAVTHAK